MLEPRVTSPAQAELLGRAQPLPSRLFLFCRRARLYRPRRKSLQARRGRVGLLFRGLFRLPVFLASFTHCALLPSTTELRTHWGGTPPANPSLSNSWDMAPRRRTFPLVSKAEPSFVRTPPGDPGKPFGATVPYEGKGVALGVPRHDDDHECLLPGARGRKRRERTGRHTRQRQAAEPRFRGCLACDGRTGRRIRGVAWPLGCPEGRAGGGRASVLAGWRTMGRRRPLRLPAGSVRSGRGRQAPRGGLEDCVDRNASQGARSRIGSTPDLCRCSMPSSRGMAAKKIRPSASVV